eukprot:5036071-Ditylum_brightwellii.AAC.1
MNEFSSIRFSKLYLSGDIPGSAKIFMLQLTDASIGMFEAMERCITLIIENGGFNTAGWYKRGVISNKSLIVARVDGLSSSNFNNNNNNNNIDEDIHVDSGEISNHFVDLTPTNQDFLDNSTVLGSRLNTLKYVVSNMRIPTMDYEV